MSSLKAKIWDKRTIEVSEFEASEYTDEIRYSVVKIKKRTDGSRYVETKEIIGNVDDLLKTFKEFMLPPTKSGRVVK